MKANFAKITENFNKNNIKMYQIVYENGHCFEIFFGQHTIFGVDT